MPPRRLPQLLLPLLVVAFGALLVWNLCARSAIPLDLHGTVVSIDARDEHPGTRNAWFVRVGDSTRHLDQGLAERLSEGDELAKDAWDRELVVNGESLPLRLSDDAKAAFWFAPAMVAAALAVTWVTLRPRPAVRSSGRPGSP